MNNDLLTILFGAFTPPPSTNTIFVDNLGMNRKADERPRRTCIGQRSDVERFVKESNRWVTAHDVAQEVDMTTTNIRYHLNSLASKGLLIERVQKMGRHYKRLYKCKPMRDAA